MGQQTGGRTRYVWVLAALLLVVSFRPAAGAQCFQVGGQYWNNTSNVNQDPSIPRAMFGRIWRPDGTTSYLAVAMGGKIMNLYSLTNPVLTTQPTVTTDVWQGFLQTIKTYPFGFISTVDGSTIGYASFSVNGYVIFSFNPSTQIVDQLYKYEWNTTNALRPAYLFTTGGQLYLVGRIPTTADGTTYMGGFSTFSVSARGIPTHLAFMNYNLSSNANAVCYLVQKPDKSKTYLYAQNGQTIDVWDISTPSSPFKVKNLALGTPDALVRDGSNADLAYWTYANTINVMDMSNPETPVQKGSITVPTGYIREPAARDGLLYVPITGSTTTMGAAYAVSLSPTGGAALVVPIPDSTPPVLNRAPVTMEGPYGAAIYGKANGLYWVYRQDMGVGDWVTVDPSCVATTPKASITVTDTTSTAASCSGTPTLPSTGTVGNGFPGDVLQVANGSTGLYQTATLKIDYVVSPTSLVPVVPLQDALANPLYTWDTAVTAPPGYTVSPPGEYLVTLDLVDSTGQHYTADKSIWLCNNPKAALAFVPPSSASMLVGEAVSLTAAASTGQPEKFGGYTFVVTPPGGGPTSFYADTTKTASYTLPATGGNYSFGVVTHYAFQAADDPNCGAAYANFLVANYYDSCSAPLSVTAGWGVSKFEVMQGGQVVVPSGGTGSILYDQPTTLRFTGRVAQNYVPNFVWNIPSVASHLTCDFSMGWPYTNATCDPIPGGTWAAATPQFAMNMNLQVCSGTPGACTELKDILPAPTVNVTPVAVGATVTPSATSVNVGQAVTFTLTGAVPAPSSFQSLVLSFPVGALCSGATSVTLCQSSSCAVGSSKATVTFQNPNPSSVPYDVTLSGTTSLGTPVAGLDTERITVGPASSGSCTQAVAMTASPNPVTAGSAITFTLTPGVTQGSSDILTVTMGDGNSRQVSGAYCGGYNPCDKVTYVYTAQGTYQASVSGTLNSAPAAGGPISVTVNRSTTVTVTVNPSPNPAQVGQLVRFSFTPALTTSNDVLWFSWGDGTASTQVKTGFGGGAVSSTTHTYASNGTFNVGVSGSIGGVTATGMTSIVVQGTTPPPPNNGLTLTVKPNPASVGDTVSVTFTPKLAAGDSVTINFGDGQSSPAACFPFSSTCGASHVYTTANTFIVSAVGKISGTDVSGNTQLVVQQNACTQTGPPVADFTWPTGQLAGFPEQQQPYAGQAVTFTDTSTGSPTQWSWNFGFYGGTSTQKNPVVTFPQAGDYTVTLTATNCKGSSTATPKPLTVNADVRHVKADFSWSPQSPSTGAQVTFAAAQGPAYGDPDTFVWTFDDGSTQSGPSATYEFKCGGPRTVMLTASRSTYNDPSGPATASHAVTVDGPACGPESVMAVDAANLQGRNGTYWRTNVRIFNPSTQLSKVTVEFLPIGYSNTARSGAFRYLDPKATWAIDDIIQWAQSQGTVGTDVTKAALRVTYDNTSGVPPIVISETYTSAPSGGGTYGQLTPGIEVVPDTTPPVLWITGIRNSGLTDGFRTNYSLVNLRGGNAQGLKFTLFDITGNAIATQFVDLAPFEYRQRSLADLFGSVATSPDPLAVRVDIPSGSDVQAYASVVDNHTGDPVLIPAVGSPTAPIVIPAVAHNRGKNGTVWRSDMQVTNPNASATHTWEVKYVAKAGDGLSSVVRSITLEPNKSLFIDDLVSWVYAESGTPLAPEAQTSGTVRIVSADQTDVYPIVQARSFNLTADGGTFGQNITPITPDMGVGLPTSTYKRLLLTGMSSADIARTNLGFVNLSVSADVNFLVYFYNEVGTPLNPRDGTGTLIPYTYALDPGGWNQDQLENRFSNVFKTPLPSGQRAISAEVFVSEGGLGTVYATVIDNQTGDPNFILAQPAP